jgi:hypothetical protein
MFSTHSYKTLLAMAVLNILLFPFDVAPAITPQSSIYLVPRWNQGQKYQFEIIKTRQRYKDGKSILKGTTRTELEIEVLKAGKEGHVIRWAFGETKFDDPKLAEIVMEQQLTNLLKGMQIILEVDSESTIIGVQNWKEVRNSVSRMLDTMTAALQKSGQDSITIEKVRAQVDSMFATKEQIELLCTREAQVYFMPLGRRYRLSKTIQYEDLLPNPLGGEPIPSRGAFSLKAINRGPGQAIVTWKQEVDPEEAARVLEKTVKDMSARIGKPVPNEERFGPLVMQDNAEFTIEIASGLVNRLIHTRVVKIGQSRQEETLEIIKKVL